MIKVESIPTSWGRLCYRRTGQGKPFVLIHSLALDGRLWEPILADFLPGHDLIMPDMRGHGGSTWDGASYAIADLAADVLGLLDALAVERCSMLGMSMGGSVAMTFAIAHSDRLDRLLLCDTTAWYGEDAVEKWKERAHTAETRSREEQIPFQTERWFNAAFRASHPDLVKHVADIFVSTDRKAHAQACLALGAMDVRNRLGSITVPTLVATGEDDYATPPSMARTLAEGIPGALIRIWPQTRHMAVIESAALRSELQTFAS